MDHEAVDRLADEAAARLALREELVSLELHRAVAHRIVNDPLAVLALVPDNIEKHRQNVHGGTAHGWLDTWEALARPDRVDELIVTMLDAGSIDLRQVAPFNYSITHEERIAAIARAAR